MTASPGRGRPVTAGRPDHGMVTAETAVVLPVLVLVLAAALWAVAAAGAQLRCVDSAREGARAVARGEPTAVAVAASRRVAPGADVVVEPAGDVVGVVVRLRVRPPGWLGDRVPALLVKARAVAGLEPGVTP